MLFRESLWTIQLEIVDSEIALLDSLASVATHQLYGDQHYLTAFSGEIWNGCFDLPFYRTRFLNYDMDLPYRDVAYADMIQIVDRFDIHDQQDLDDNYEYLIGNETMPVIEVQPSRSSAYTTKSNGLLD